MNLLKYRMLRRKQRNTIKLLNKRFVTRSCVDDLHDILWFLDVENTELAYRKCCDIIRRCGDSLFPNEERRYIGIREEEFNEKPIKIPIDDKEVEKE